MNELSTGTIETTEAARRLHDEAAAFTDRIKEQAGQALFMYWQVGHFLLNRKEALGHGRWLDYLKSHWSDVSVRHVRNYLRLATRYQLSEVMQMAQDGGSLRQALQMMPPVDNAGEGHAPSPPRPTRLVLERWVNEGSKWWQRNIEQRGGLESLPEHELARLRQQTRPMYERLVRIHGSQPRGKASL